MHLDAVQSGMFIVDCDSYYTTAQNGAGQHRRLHIVHNSETPATTYAIIDTGTKQVTLSADLLFDFILPRFDHMYQSKKNLKIESKGSRYEIGDFVVKIGTVTMSGHYKGILVEVEYLPCAVPALCWTLMREFMQSFMGSCVNPQAPPYIQNRFHDIHAAQDTVQQYVEKFNEFRDGSTYSGAQANAPNS
nr:mediator of RNA polymerase II transcription subunit 20-like [Penaeus vannamei]